MGRSAPDRGSGARRFDTVTEVRPSAAATPEELPSLSRQAFWLMAAKTIGFGFSFLLPVVLVRVLSQAQFGLYKQSFLVAGTAQTILPLGFGLSAFYFLPRERERRQAIVLNIAGFNLVAGLLALVLLVAWPRALVVVFGSADLVPYAPLIGSVILLSIFSSFLEIVATANQEVKYSTVFIVAAQLSKSVYMLCAALWFSTLPALLIAGILQGITQSAILLWYLNSRFPRFWAAIDWGLLRIQLSYALPLGLAGLIYSLQSDLHSYFVANAFGPSSYAIYAVGCFQLPLIGILMESVGAVMIPRVSRLQHEGRRREILEVTARAMRKLAAVYWPLYFFLLVTGRDFLVFLFTPRYEASWSIFAVYLTLIPLGMLVYDPVLRAFTEHRYFLLKTRIGMLCVLLVALSFGISRFGMQGAVGSVVAVALLERGILSWKVARILKVRAADLILLRGVAKLGAAAALAGLVEAISHPLFPGRPLPALVCGAAVFGAVYAGLVLALQVPEQSEIDAVWNRVAWRRNR
jgi:O-antigen/teichoic acid export membrane protein